jgi:hypothetical protein
MKRGDVYRCVKCGVAVVAEDAEHARTLERSEVSFQR